jgi:hypothetical protein
MTKLIKAKAALDKAAARLDKDKSEEALRSLRARVKVSLDASNLMVSMVVHAKGVATGKPEVHVCMDDSLSGNMRLSRALRRMTASASAAWLTCSSLSQPC